MGELINYGVNQFRRKDLSNSMSAGKESGDINVYDDQDDIGDVPVKVLMCGDSGSGKSSLLLRLCDGRFSSGLMSTIGLDFKKRVISADGFSVPLQIWDAAGQERFRTIVASYFRGAQAVMFCFDITNADSFNHVRGWLNQADSYADEHIPRVLVGCKLDLAEQAAPPGRAVTIAAAKALAADCKMHSYVETSAKTGTGVDLAFTDLARAVVRKRAKQLRQSSGKTNAHLSHPNSAQKDDTGCCKI
jgi:Ras-related protein Rab-1A